MEAVYRARQAGVCSEIVDDGQRVCCGVVVAEVSWNDPARAGVHVVRRVCETCADWLMGFGGAHLHPVRIPIDSELAGVVCSCGRPAVRMLPGPDGELSVPYCGIPGR